jgi:RNA polymerase sigma factor (sigma-70 family)
MSVNAMIEQNREISKVVEEQRSRLRSFIRKRVPNEADVEDLLQEVFYELVRARRLLMPVDYLTGWLFRVARNRITDLFRKKKPDNFGDLAVDPDEDEFLDLGELLPSPEDGPEALYARKVMLDRLETALAQLPPEQRSVFVAHEFEGRSFKELAAETGTPMSTLLARKRYAVHFLRRRLKNMHEELLRK